MDEVTQHTMQQLMEMGFVELRMLGRKMGLDMRGKRQKEIAKDVVAAETSTLTVDAPASTNGSAGFSHAGIAAVLAQIGSSFIELSAMVYALDKPVEVEKVEEKPKPVKAKASPPPPPPPPPPAPPQAEEDDDEDEEDDEEEEELNFELTPEQLAAMKLPELVELAGKLNKAFGITLDLKAKASVLRKAIETALEEFADKEDDEDEPADAEEDEDDDADENSEADEEEDSEEDEEDDEDEEDEPDKPLDPPSWVVKGAKAEVFIDDEWIPGVVVSATATRVRVEPDDGSGAVIVDDWDELRQPAPPPPPAPAAPVKKARRASK